MNEWIYTQVETIYLKELAWSLNMAVISVVLSKPSKIVRKSFIFRLLQKTEILKGLSNRLIS